MSLTTANTASDDTLIRDSQLSGFGAFKERLGLCCCRILKKSSTYDLSSVSKNVEELQDKPSYVNQAFQREKQVRKEKLDKIARTLPKPISNGQQGIRTPSSSSLNQTPTRPLTTINQGTPRSALSLTRQTKTPINTTNSKSGLSTMNRPSPLTSNTRNKKKESDQTSTDASSEEESSESENKSSDSDRAPAKKTPLKNTNKRR